MSEKLNLYNILKLFCFAVVMVTAATIARPSPSCAQNTGLNAGCATDTWTAMVNQATLETRREDMMNKRYIVKADSVLQYSCFADEVANMANTIAAIFSNNELWGEKEVRLYDGQTEVPINVFKNGFSTSSLEEALSLVVDESLIAYVTGQFNHPVLSGTVPSQATELCYNMASVWKAAKCKNFDGTQVFYTFEELVNFDPREFPPNMPCEL